MGPELLAAAPYLFAGGTALSLYGQHEQQRKQQGILNAAQAQNTQDQQKGAAAVVQESQNLSPQARQAAMAQQEQQAYGQTQADLAAAGPGSMGAGGATIGGPSQGSDANVSPDFMKAKADAALAEGTRATAIAQELSKLRAPGMAGVNDSMRRGSLTEQLGSMYSSGRQRTNAAGLDADSVGMPAIGQIGQVAQLVGGASMLGGAGVPGATVAETATTPALIESTAGTAGYGGSSASAAAAPLAARTVSMPWWASASQMASPMFRPQQRGWTGR